MQPAVRSPLNVRSASFWHSHQESANCSPNIDEIHRRSRPIGSLITRLPSSVRDSGHSLPSPTDANVCSMPRISAFYGIVIWMYHDEAHHGGRPHFHASYGGDEAAVDI